MWKLLLIGVLLGAGGSEGSEEAPTVGVQRLQALHCPPCERIHCSTRRALKLQCKGGVTTGVCGCCPVCARVEGEACGGAWDYLGKCDKGLVCAYQESDTDRPDRERRGVCEAVIDSLEPETCQPECTREFCQAHPAEICSARFVSLQKAGCQDSCQHTSCSSCLLLTPPSCPQTCSDSDPACQRLFGKCVHKNLAAVHSNHRCLNNLQGNTNGHFLCLVPPCLTASA